MKPIHFHFFLIVISAALPSACTSDETPEPVNAEVEGTYRLTFYEHTATHLQNFGDGWEPKFVNLHSKATDISMNITFNPDGTFRVEGGYTGAPADPGAQEHAMASKSADYLRVGRWKMEGSKLYISDDGFLGHPLSLDPLTAALHNADEDFPLDGLNVLGITEAKITLELIAVREQRLSGIPSRLTYIGTIVFEK